MRLDPDILTELAREFGMSATQGAIALVARDAVDVTQVGRQSGVIEVVAEIVDDGMVRVDLDIDDQDLDLVDYGCDRDGPFGCSHVLASLLTILSSHGVGPPQPPAAPWQRTLDSLLPTADLADAGERAFFVSVVDPTVGRDAWAYGRRRTPFLGIRLAERGKRGAWIKGQLDWRGLHYRGATSRAESLVDELYGLYAIHGGRESYYAPEWLPLEEFSSRGLLAVLDELREAGVPMVSVGKQQRPVIVAAEPATVRIVAREHRKRLQVRGELLIDGAPVEARGVYPVGEPAVAVATVIDPGEASEQITLHRLDRPADPALWRMLRSTDSVSVDAAGRERFETEYLPRLRTLAPVTSPDGSYRVPEPPRLTLHLHVTDAEGDVRLAWRWSGTVPGAAPDPGERRAILGRVRDAVGDQRVLIYGGSEGEEPTDRVLTGADAVLAVAEVLPRLRELDQVEVTQSEAVPDYRATVGGAQVSVAAQPSENDWFDLHVRVDVDGQQVEFAQVFRALAAGEPIFVLPDGRYFSLVGPEFDRLRAIIEEARRLGDRPVESLRISRYQADLWAELVELGIVDAQEQEWLSHLRALGDAAALEPVPVPDGVHAELRHYQRRPRVADVPATAPARRHPRRRHGAGQDPAGHRDDGAGA